MHDEFCPAVGLPVMCSDTGDIQCACEAIRKARDDEQRHHIDRYKATITEIRKDERWRLAVMWDRDGHDVMFNKARDDLTPQQRVGKWLRSHHG